MGDLRQIDEYTIEWKPRRLLPSTTYRCIVQGLVLETSSGYETAAPMELEFTTVDQVPRLQSNTLDSNRILSCSTPVWLNFTQPLQHDVSISDLLVVEQQQSSGKWSPVPAVHIQRITSTQYCLIPTQRWSSGYPLSIKVQLSRITGDETDDRRLESMIRGAARVTVKAASTDNRSIPEAITQAAEQQSTVITQHSELALSMPPSAEGRWRFVHWECPSLEQLHGSLLPSFQTSIDCSDLRQSIEVRAVYEFLDTIGVTVTSDTLGTVLILDQDGRQLAEVDDSTTLHVDTSITRLFLVARPITGSTFSSWSSSISGCNLITAPSMNVPVAAITASLYHSRQSSQSSPQGGQTQSKPHVYINPRFQKLTPLSGDWFRLRARLMNVQPEEGYNVDEHITFTTPNLFEETTRQTRTVCVVADDCWEIIGYHDAAEGSPVWFDRGRKELCVDAELLDPENTLVIFGRRVPIDLRLERVMLASEDDNDVIDLRAPHSETRIDIDKLVTVNGIQSWLPVASSICVVDGLSTQRAGLRCGDKVRLVVRAATQRGEQWRWWSARNKFVLPREADSVGKAPAYTLKIEESVANFDAVSCDGVQLGHRELAVRAAFRQRFVVESIALRVRKHAGGERWKSSFEERWYDPLMYYDVDPDEPIGGRQVEYIPRRGTTIKLKFSRPIDAMSVYDGAITAECFGNILHTDPQARNLDFSTSSTDHGNALIHSTTGQYLDVVEFAVYKPGTQPVMQAMHAGMIDLLCTTGIRSIDNEALQTAQLFAIRRMELPGFGIRATDATFAYDGDTDYLPWEDHGEMYHALYGMNTAPRAPRVNADGFVRYPDCRQQSTPDGECTRECGDDGEVFPFGDREIWLQTAWMDWSDLAFARIGSWDEDCQADDKCLVNELREILAELQRRSDEYKGDSVPTTKDDVITDIVSLASQLIAALLPVAEQDDPIGEVSFVESSGTLWGMLSAVAPSIFLSEENAEYRLRGQWFVSRAVVR